MLESIVLHQSGTGVRGGDGNVVGISWKTLTRSHPSPSLVVTCTHQVVVYKPGESRRTHQWSFKPSAATALSHAAVFLPAGSRYVGVQQGSTLVSWKESELDVKRPLSAQASGAVQAVHACPQLGDYFVAVLSSGGVALYQGGLQLAARCDEAAGGSVSASASPANAKTRARAGAQVHAKAVWSGVRGNKVLVLENIGATNRITTFVLSAPPPQRRTNASAGADAASASPSASVTLVSSHALTKPLSLTGAPEEEEASTTACAAAFLGGEGEGGRGVVSVAWRTSRGPAWTKVVLDAAGAREELARPVATMAAAAMVECNGNGSGGVSNGHGGSPKKASARSKKSAEAGNSGGVDGWGSVPAVASADGGRLLVHSGGATPRLAIWDASYGVLLDDDGAPGSDVGGKAVGKAVSMVVSGDGAHVGISAAGRVLICPLPVKEAGTLASLLRRKRPSSSSAVATAAAAGGGRGGGGLSGLAFPSVDLARNGPASSLLGRSGALEAAEWEAAVVTPFREAEAKVIQSLHTAARWKDRDAFERVLREHGQRRASAAAAAGGVPSGDVAEGGVGEGGQEGRKRRRRREEREGADYSPGVVAAAVELCLKNPEAGLWNSLAVLVRSGGVSARHHRGLVASIVEHASPELLEEVMLHVPDLPEADAVRILRHFLAHAAASAEELPSVAAAAAAAAVAASGAALVASAPPPTDSAGVLHPAKRARGAAPIAGTGIDGGVDGIAVEVLSSPKRGGGGDGKGTEKDESASTSKKSKKSKKEDKKRRKSAALDSATLPAPDAMDEEEEVTENAGRHNKHANGVVAPNLSNGNGVHAAAATAVATQEDRGTSGDSGGCSNNETQDADSPPGTGDANNPEKNKKKRARAGGVGSDEDTPAARAERGVRVALMFPHNEAFLRSALAGLSHGEVVVVLKVLTRLIAEGRTKESSARSAVNRRGGATKATHGLPPARTDLVLGWAAAVLDAHFARLAVGGAADAGLVSALKALKRATRGEAICCELLCEVRSLVDELGRQHAAAAAAAAAVSAASKRHPKRDLFTLRVLRF